MERRGKERILSYTIDYKINRPETTFTKQQFFFCIQILYTSVYHIIIKDDL